MRRLTFVCFLVTLVFSAALLVHASEPPQEKTASSSVLDHRAEWANLENVIVAQAVINALLDAGVPGGVARVSNCKQELTHSFNPGDRSLRGILDSIVSTEPAYRWQLDGDAINVLPIGALPAFLTVRISRFEVTDFESPEEALSKLLALPEVKQAQLAVGPRAVQGGAYPFCPNGCPAEEKKKLSVSVTDVTMREALNAIARVHGNAVWSFWQSDCGGRKVFSLDIAAR